jgi:hypothetical protein
MSHFEINKEKPSSQSVWWLAVNKSLLADLNPFDFLSYDSKVHRKKVCYK